MRRDPAARTAMSAKVTACDLLSRLVPLPDPAQPASYLVTPETKAALHRNLFRHLFESVPTPAALLPCDPSTSIQDAVNLVGSYDWNLSRAQIEESREIALARKKGKQAQRAQSPWSTSSAYDDAEDPDLLGPEYSEARRGMPCGHLFEKGEAIYRCRDCGLDDTCVQCAPCFQASIHSKEGHDVVFSVSTSSGGCCDCGDVEAWKQDVCCRYHSEIAPSESATGTDMELEADSQDRAQTSSSAVPQPAPANASEEADGLDQIDQGLSELPGHLRDPLLDAITELVTLIVTVFDHAPDFDLNPKLLPTPDAISALSSLEDGLISQQSSRTPSKRKSSSNGPHDSDEEMSAVEVENLVGESIDEDGDDLDTDRGSWGSRNRRYNRSGELKQTAEAGDWESTQHRFSGSSENAGEFTNEILEMNKASASRRKSSLDSSKSQAARNTNRQYAVLLWNDEKHSFAQVIDIVTDATGRSEHEAKGVAERVDKHGRELIEVNTDLRRLYQIARILLSIDLAVTLRPAFDVFAEEVVQVVLNFLMDLSNCNVYLPSTRDASSSSWYSQPLKPDAAVFKQIVTRSFFAPFHPMTPIEAGSMSPEFFDPSQLTNYEGLLLMDCKLWKSARIDIKALLMSLIARREIKKEISLRFAKIYPKLVETFMISDREQEYSICFLTVQLFSVPSIATMLVEKLDFLHKLLLLLQSFFTCFRSTETAGLILPPPRTPAHSQANVHLMLLRQSRSYHIFYDIRYLLASEGVQKLIASQGKRHVSYILDCLALFQAIHPSKRAVSAHVEFESEIWISVFHISSHLGKAAKMFGEAFAHAGPQELIEAIDDTFNAICWKCAELTAADQNTHPFMMFKDVSYTIGSTAETKNMSVISFAVDSKPVSFHHPMHWVLAELIRQVPVVGHQALQQYSGKQNLYELLSARNDERQLLIALDFPLRVCVRLAQIRCNMWVRNGFGIRSQAHHYRDNSMRGIMYDQDLLLIQAGFALVDTDRFLLTVLHRFRLLPWFNQADDSGDKPYDEVQGVFLAEEFLFLIVTCLSELSSLCAWSIEAQIRREVIHFLALGQGTFSDVTKHIPEKYTDHAAFERILSQVSTFRAPDGTHDFGIFELKDECYADIQPFFFHYTRNQREKVEEVIRTRQKKRLAQSSDKVVSAIKDEDLPPIVPSPALHQVRGTLFDRLADVVSNDILVSLVFRVLDNTRVLYTYAPDMLVDAALQIIMIGLVDAADSFADKAATVRVTKLPAQDGETTDFDASPESTLVELLCHIELLEKFKPFKNKVVWCLEKAAAHSEAARSVVQTHFQATGRGGVSASGGDAASSGVSKQKSAEEARRAAAKARQAAIMQKFSAQQKSLLDQLGADDDDDDEDDEGEVDAATSALGAEARAPKKSWGSCILCQENLGADKAFGSLAHIQPSRMMRMTPKQDAPSLQQALDTPLTMDRSGSDGKRIQGTPPMGRTGLPQTHPHKARQGPAYGSFPQEDHRFGFYASTCGHLMHLHCFETYCRSVEQRHTQQIARNHPEDLHRSEFICPLCKSLGNVILPVADVAAAGESAANASSVFVPFGSVTADETPLQDWIRKINIDILKHSSKTNLADYQETDHGSGAFLPFFVDHSQSSLQMRLEFANIDENTAQMIDRLMNVLKPMSHDTKAAREKLQQHTILAPQGRKMYVPEELVAYTIAMLEASQRGMTPSPSTDCAVPVEKRSVAHALNDSVVDLLRSLIHCLRISTLTYHEGSKGPDIIRRGLLKRLLPHWGGDDAVRSPLLLRDPMTILIEAAVVAPEALTQCTALMYYVCLVQTVFGLAQPSIWPQMYGHMGNMFGSTSAPRPGAGLKTGQISKEDIEEARLIFPDVRWTVANIIGFVGYARGNITLGFDNLDDDTLAKMICSYTLPFLRRAAMLRRVVGVSSTASEGAMDLSESSGEYRRLFAELEIPLPSVALPVRAEKQTPMAGLVEGWIKHAYVPLASLFRPLPIQPAPLGNSLFPTQGLGAHDRPSSALAATSSGSASGSLATGTLGRPSAGLHSLTSSYLQAVESRPTLLLEHPHIYELARLPEDLATLLQDTRRRTCKKCGSVPSEPALCLLCGDVVCLQSFCCQSDEDGEKGECNQHMDACGGAVGVYFKIKSNLVLLLYQGNGTFHFLSPYLDSHGEIDVGLRKGRPQKLHQQRYDELRKQIWAHGVANIVARKIEAAMDQGGWQTF